ncbi:glycosyltransferase family 2 protein [Tardiphaga sp. 709]|uniref:glycosyltransferase family 2 protein n=1 Tax=Tardiphaga sp. 709 TaxID=3076039 RepID=UPI0028F03025|nr:glycosyltransferase family 2 protein [Tardiphaga sp. 709]WNV09167.1 glycosyltransferase family 2 protein [Tardiphaga sp. 709]
MPHLSIVAPVYNEPLSTVTALTSRVALAVADITDDYEIILVDDGSKRETWEAIRSASSNEPRVLGLRFARNFGQHVAISAGIDKAEGDWVIVMDSDLQDRPEVIPELYAKALEGFDVVFVRRQLRPESLLYRGGARFFYKVLNLLSGQEYNRLYGNFSIISRKVVIAFRSLPESSRFYGGMLSWLGFPETSILAQHGTRQAGSTNYNIKRRVFWALKLIIGFSTRLLYLSISLGFLLALLSLVMGSAILFEKVMYPEKPLPGWPSVFTAVLFIGGITNIALGIIGIYIGRIFEETKRRPLYVISELTR